MQHLRLTHPALDFWIDVRIQGFDGRWPAVADLADMPEVGTGEMPEDEGRRRSDRRCVDPGRDHARDQGQRRRVPGARGIPGAVGLTGRLATTR